MNNHTDGKPIETMLSVKPTTLTLYGYYHGDRTITHDVTTLDNKHKGELSEKARRRLKDSCNWLYMLNERKNKLNKTSKKLVFLTLTLPSQQRHSDKIIKSKILNQFLVELRDKFNMSMYVWRAERQLNGNIHFHLILDCFVPKNDLRVLFNRICAKLDYVAPYTNRMSKMDFQQYSEYRLKTNPKLTFDELNEAFKYGISTKWMQPPSTDVRGVKDVKQLTNYLSKYLSKEISGEFALHPIEGRIWFVSRELSKIRNCSISVDETVINEVEQITKENDCHVVEDSESGFVCYCVDFDKWYGKSKFLTDTLNLFLDCIINDIEFDHHYHRGFDPFIKKPPLITKVVSKIVENVVLPASQLIINFQNKE